MTRRPRHLRRAGDDFAADELEVELDALNGWKISRS
jgi:hypothetical protein